MTFCLFKQQKILNLGNEARPVLDLLSHWQYHKLNVDAIRPRIRFLQSNDDLVIRTG